MKQNLCDHIGICTNQAERMVKFYIDKFGFQKSKEEILERSIAKPIFGLNSTFKFIRLTSGSVMIEIFEPMSVPAKRQKNIIAGYHHWGCCVSNRLEFVQALKRKKVKIIEVKRNSHIVYFVRDPDGNMIEIREI